jgi:hypothetical protein
MCIVIELTSLQGVGSWVFTSFECSELDSGFDKIFSAFKCAVSQYYLVYEKSKSACVIGYLEITVLDNHCKQTTQTEGS